MLLAGISLLSVCTLMNATDVGFASYRDAAGDCYYVLL
jgi:hypothetical protein